MASNAATMTWKDIQALDRVGPSYSPVEEMSAERKARILLLADKDFGYNWEFNCNEHAVLIHEEGGRTYLRGWCPSLGLDVPRGHTITERECEELRGRTVVQAVFSWGIAAYVLTDDGLLFSCGDPSSAKLGRRGTSMSHNKFGRVAIDGPVLAVAAGLSHVLAMTATKVFAFGWNLYCQAGVTGMQEVCEPREIYSGEGPNAPKQVSCGFYHSAILTVGGQVLTCGHGRYAGHGHDDKVPHMTPVPKLQHVAVQQVGCTGHGTYALADGMLYGWGNNRGGRLCVASQDDIILVPMVVDCAGHRISSIWCSYSMVLALTDTGEVLHWGDCSGGTVISSPRRVEGCRFPREVFARGYYPDSGGTVYLDTPENNNRVFAAAYDTRDAAGTELRGATATITELETKLQGATATNAELETKLQGATAINAELETKLLGATATIAELETKLQGATAKTTELETKFQGATTKITELETELQRATGKITELETKLQGATSKITKLDNALGEATRRESAANDARTSAEEKVREANTQITALHTAIDKANTRGMAVNNELAANEARLRSTENENRALQNAIEEASRREAVAWESCNAARESLRSLDEEHQVLQSRVVQLQLELESAREQATLRENVVNEGQYIREAAVRELMEEFQTAVRNADREARGASAAGIEGRTSSVDGDQYIREIIAGELRTSQLVDEVKNAVRDVMRETRDTSATGIDGRESTQEDRNDLDSRIANLERENSELRRDNRELMVNYREITMDYRDLHHDYQQLLVDSQREAHRGYGGSAPLLPTRGRGSDRSEADSLRDTVTSRDPTHRGRGSQRQSRQRPGRLHQQPPTDDGSGRR